MLLLLRQKLTYFSDQIVRIISQIINNVSIVLQKLPKCFDGIAQLLYVTLVLFGVKF